jgi:hypothetical protein
MVEKTMASTKVILCITGLEKHMVEKDLIKLIRKFFNAGSEAKT